LASDLAVLSNSPELLVRVHNGMALAEPIKGTRPRAADEQTDARLAAELEASPKERAELTMIVDLLRNDLGKVAQPGTVVAGNRHIQAHANVHHASQRIRAELNAGTDAWDVLAALLPYGSVTGAPKVRACKRIHELESQPRGVYCGGIGFVSDGGDARWSVAIRTAVIHGTNARYHVGGGIVAESEPRAEWLETEAKGLALAKALHPEPALSKEDFDADNFWSKRS
jgi:anthranilate/para-aminobenzoate synthase component I